MPRGPAPAWRARKPPVLDAYIIASVNQAGGPGKHHPDTGHYATLRIRGLADKDEAAEYRRALFRCAYYMHRTGQLDVSMSANVKRDGNGWMVVFHAVDKTLARKHHLEKHGTDRSKWPYDPRRRGGA